MTVPSDYTQAGRVFDQLLTDISDICNVGTRHQAYAVLFAVLRVFRHRLTAEEIMIFADCLPAMLRAMFVNGWSPREERRPFATLEDYDREARAIRSNHNLMPEGSFRMVATLVRVRCIPLAFDDSIKRLRPEVRQFWRDAANY
jgi:uncharacterized protein (DUF2267 family)